MTYSANNMVKHLCRNPTILTGSKSSLYTVFNMETTCLQYNVYHGIYRYNYREQDAFVCCPTQWRCACKAG